MISILLMMFAVAVLVWFTASFCAMQFFASAMSLGGYRARLRDYRPFLIPAALFVAAAIVRLHGH